MDVFFTTVVRKAPLKKGGEILRVNWESKQVLSKKNLIPDDPPFNDPNPRGNGRGGRGICIMNHFLYVAIYHQILKFNKKLELVGKINNNLFVGLHEVAVNNETLWVASTAIDAALGIDAAGNTCGEWWSRENENLKRRFNLEPQNINKKLDNRTLWLRPKEQKGDSHTHLNAVAFYNDQLFVLLNRYGVVYNTVKDRILIEDPSIKGCHNLVFIGDKLLINDSHGRKIMVYSDKGFFLKNIRLQYFPEIKKIHQNVISHSPKIAKTLFVRGLCPIEPNKVLIGFSPATIAEIDIEKDRLEDIFQYSTDAAVCIHGLNMWK